MDMYSSRIIIRDDIEVLQQIMGHSKIETTMTYVHIVNEDMEEQAGYLDDIFRFPKIEY